MKPDQQNRERLVMLLAKAFLGLIVAILLSTIFVYWLSGQYYEELRKAPNIEEMRKDINILSANYEEVYLDQYLGPDGAFAVVTTSGHMMYRSSEIIRPYFTIGELDCIATYGQNSYVEYMTFSFSDGSQQYVYIKHSFTEQNEEVQQMMILDDAYHVISGGFGDGREFYTPTEVSFLSGTVLAGYDYHKCYIMGGNLILLIVSPTQDAAYFAELMDQAEKMYLLLIPLYVAAFTAFLYWVSRQIKQPLEMLNEAIENFRVGDAVKTGELRGPWEISQIGQNFDRMAEQLAESESERKKLDQARQTMIADISHDLKTPITVLSGYTQAIVDGKIRDDQLEAYLDLINHKSKELTGMISSFHEFSKMDHPEFSLQMQRRDICEFVRGYLADRYEEIEFYGLDLEAMIPEDEEYYSEIDEDLMRRALDNILYNALRYNKQGTELIVSVFTKDREPDFVVKQNTFVCITIADNGIGIAENKRDKIFEPFVKGDDSRTGRGSGLGLAITQKIIQGHGGFIRLCSTEETAHSTEFEILLPEVE